MKKNIRRGVFETNSSSSHSIVINEAIKLCVDDKYYNGLAEYEEDGCIYSSGGYFYCEVDIIREAKEKIDYLVSYLFENSKDSTPDHDDLYLKLYKAIKNLTGLELVVIPRDNDKYFPFGSIDRESINVPSQVLRGSIEQIQAFIFNERNILLIEGNN